MECKDVKQGPYVWVIMLEDSQELGNIVLVLVHMLDIIVVLRIQL